MDDVKTRVRSAVGRMHPAVGGVLCLDFANTLEPRGGPPPITVPDGFVFRDELRTYDDLVGWTVHKEVVSEERGEALVRAALRAPHEADETLTRAHILRDVIYRACWNLAHGDAPAPEDLATVAKEYADAAAHVALRVTRDHVTWVWPNTGAALAEPLWHVAWSAAELLTTGDHRRIKVCPGLGRPPVSCGWLFYDRSKNGSRRWCSMTDCGFAAKARLQTARRRAARTR